MGVVSMQMVVLVLLVCRCIKRWEVECPMRLGVVEHGIELQHFCLSLLGADNAAVGKSQAKQSSGMMAGSQRTHESEDHQWGMELTQRERERDEPSVRLTVGEWEK